MNYVLPITIIAMLVTFNGILDGFSEELIISAEPTSLVYDVGMFPSITGDVVNSQGELISGVYVYALFPSQTTDFVTRNDGSFFLRQPDSLPVGEYSVDVYARSNIVLSKTTVVFEIQEPAEPLRPSWLSNNTLTQSVNSTKQNLSSVKSIDKNEDFDLILQQIEIQKQQEEKEIAKKNNLTNQMEFIEQQRKLSQDNLEQDLLGNTRDLQVKENKNAFASFVAKLDAIMYSIFWDQFEFTQKISDEGYQAKVSALNEGKTSQDAMKAYQNKAAVSQKELLNYVEEINIKHGFSNSTVQEQFDENGKIPRNHQNNPP